MGKKGKSGSKRGAGFAKWQKKKPKKARPAARNRRTATADLGSAGTNYHEAMRS